MIIKKLVVKGENKKDAKLEFKKGLNSIIGASDTGKSYVIQCLKFILGSKIVPKGIDQATGYTEVVVTYELEDEEWFSLSRELVEKSKITLFENKSKKTTTLSSKHGKGLKNISNWFLNKIQLDDKILLKGVEKLTLQSLSLRTLEKIFLIDETRIIADYSPLGSGQYTEQTLEKTLLKILLTGDDDSRVSEIKINLEEYNILERRIANLTHLIEKVYPYSEEKEKELRKANRRLRRLSRKHEVLNIELNEAISLNKNTLKSRNNIFKQIDKIQNEKNEKSVLLERFKLLESKYISDKERLEGLNEATEYIEFYEEASCPSCGQEYSEMVSEEYIDNILKSVKAEIRKIDNNIFGLNNTIDDLYLDIKEISSFLSNLEFELSEYNNILDVDIKDKLGEVNQVKRLIDILKNETIDDNYKVSARKKSEEEKEGLSKKLDTKEISYQIDNFDKELKSLNSNIENILKRWSFEDCTPTTFNYKTRDINIGGKERSHFGKGFRAIGFSAFAIGLMVDLKKSNRHPGFVILDSPLTAYKKADENNDKETKEEELSENLIYGFYRDLCDSYNDNQVIVFDNQEPDPSLHSKMNYIHFSKNKSIGRYGFFEL